MKIYFISLLLILAILAPNNLNSLTRAGGGGSKPIPSKPAPSKPTPTKPSNPKPSNPTPSKPAPTAPAKPTPAPEKPASQNQNNNSQPQNNQNSSQRNNQNNNLLPAIGAGLVGGAVAGTIANGFDNPDVTVINNYQSSSFSDSSNFSQEQLTPEQLKEVKKNQENWLSGFISLVLILGIIFVVGKTVKKF